MLVFSGDIGENSPIIRSRICQGLDFLGIGLDEGQNRKNSSKISKEHSKVLVMVIHADEELVIAESLANQYFKDKSDDKSKEPEQQKKVFLMLRYSDHLFTELHSFRSLFFLFCTTYMACIEASFVVRCLWSG